MSSLGSALMGSTERCRAASSHLCNIGRMLKSGAEKGVRTLDILLGKQMLYH
jgi:hypothetical protein